MWNDLGKLNESARKNEGDGQRCACIWNFNLTEEEEEEKSRTVCLELIRNVLILTDAWINYAMESIALGGWMTAVRLAQSTHFMIVFALTLVAILAGLWTLYGTGFMCVCRHIRLLHLIVKQFYIARNALRSFGF